MFFAGAPIDSILACGPAVLRTSPSDPGPGAGAHTDPGRGGHPVWAVGIGQVRRALRTHALEVLHVVFAPIERRPLLLGIARIRNATAELLRLRYSELWGVEGRAVPDSPSEGVALCTTDHGQRALADVAVAIRGRAPAHADNGLALDFDLVIPPDATRELHLAYVAPEPDESPGPLVQAWRGAVPAALTEMVSAWSARLGRASIAGYRAAAGASDGAA